MMDSLWLAEKSAIVLDFGTRFLKYGIAGDHEPHFGTPVASLPTSSAFVVPNASSRRRTSTDAKKGGGDTAVSRLEDDAAVLAFSARHSVAGGVALGSPLEKNVDAQGQPLSIRRWEGILHEFLHQLYHVQLGVTPSERAVVVCEPFLSIKPFKTTLVKCLFEYLGVPSISFLPTLVAPLYCLGIQTGLVVDVGHNSCRVLPSCFGVPLYEAYVDCTGIGGKSVDEELLALLLTSNAALARRNSLGGEAPQPHLTRKDLISLLTPAVLEDVKVKTVYVRYCRPGNDNEPSFFESQHATSYPIDGEEHTVITVRARDRWAASEVLFGGGQKPDSEASIQYVICKSLEKCPVDVRRLVVQNIMLCGGSTQLKGFLTRLAQELSMELKAHSKLAALERYVNFGLPPFSAITRPWVGASIYGSLEGIKAYSREDYFRGVPIPDWTNWADDILYNASNQALSTVLPSSYSIAQKGFHREGESPDILAHLLER